MSDRSSVRQARMRRLTTWLGALGVVGVGVAWVAPDVFWHTYGGWSVSWPDYVVFMIPGALPFLLITFGRPRRPLVSLTVCLVLIGLNSYLYTFTFLSDSSTRGLNAIGAVLYSWVIWGVAMVVDNWRRERAPSPVPPPRPDRN